MTTSSCEGDCLGGCNTFIRSSVTSLLADVLLCLVPGTNSRFLPVNCLSNSLPEFDVFMNIHSTCFLTFLVSFHVRHGGQKWV